MKAVAIACLAIAGFFELTMSTISDPSDHVRVYIGTYTRGASEGIYLLDLNLDTGALASQGLVAKTENPAFLAIHPGGEFVYAVNELSEWDGKASGAVSAFIIDPKSGMLSLLNQQSSEGTGPCFLAVDKAGKNVLVANYGGGSVASLPVGEDGRLGHASATVQHEGSSVNPERQEGPHAHSINVDPANRYALAADLGLDKVLIYRFDADRGMLTSNDPPHGSVDAGAGPRHLAFRPDGRFAYVVNEMHLTVTAFAYDSGRGRLTNIQTVSTLPGEVEPGYSTAEILVHPSGKFLYASNRGHDTIAVFAINEETGKLSAVEHEPTQGRTPRGFGIDPTGKFLLAANQRTDTIVVFSIDQDTGVLTPTGHSASVPTPVSVKFAR